MTNFVNGIVEVLLGVLAIEEGGSFFERKALGFDDHEVAERKLERNPAAVHDLRAITCEKGVHIPREKEDTYVVLPGNGTQGDRVDVLVEDNRQRDGEVEDVETLCTKLVRQKSI